MAAIILYESTRARGLRRTWGRGDGCLRSSCSDGIRCRTGAGSAEKSWKGDGVPRPGTPTGEQSWLPNRRIRRRRQLSPSPPPPPVLRVSGGWAPRGRRCGVELFHAPGSTPGAASTSAPTNRRWDQHLDDDMHQVGLRSRRGTAGDRPAPQSGPRPCRSTLLVTRSGPRPARRAGLHGSSRCLAALARHRRRSRSWRALFQARAGPHSRRERRAGLSGTDLADPQDEAELEHRHESESHDGTGHSRWRCPRPLGSTPTT